MTALTPIETHYAGCRFRSRLEARWAVFFDHANIPWRYEPQGYDLGQAGPYLPDFLLYPDGDLRMWFEVKGQPPSLEELEKARLLAEMTGTRVGVFFGDITAPGVGLSAIADPAGYHRQAASGPKWVFDIDGWTELPWDSSAPAEWQVDLKPTAYMCAPSSRGYRALLGDWWWTDCPWCHRVVPKLRGQIGICPLVDADDQEQTHRERGTHLYPQWGHESPRLLAAYRAARSARFEHGERP